SGSNGEFLLESLEYEGWTEFTVELPRPPFGLPRGPEMQTLGINPAEFAAPDAEVFEHQFNINEYRWLIVDYDESLRTVIAERGEFPYPIYILQRKAGDAWRDAAADEFIAVNEG